MTLNPRSEKLGSNWNTDSQRSGHAALLSFKERDRAGDRTRRGQCTVKWGSLKNEEPKARMEPRADEREPRAEGSKAFTPPEAAEARAKEEPQVPSETDHPRVALVRRREESVYVVESMTGAKPEGALRREAAHGSRGGPFWCVTANKGKCSREGWWGTKLENRRKGVSRTMSRDARRRCGGGDRVAECSAST